MAAIVDASNFQLTWLSLPFALATVVVVCIGLYVLFITGAQSSRAAFLLLCSGLAPLMAAYAIAGTLNHEDSVLSFYYFGLTLAPMAYLGILIFECVLARQVAEHRWLLIVAVSVSLLQTIPILTTDWYIHGVRQTHRGLWLVTPGPLVPVLLATCGLWQILTARLLWQQLRGQPDPLRRRQIICSLVATVLLGLCIGDALLAYEIGMYPLSWLFVIVAVGLLLRSLLSDVQIDVHSIDRRGLLVLCYAAAVVVGMEMIWDLGGDALSLAPLVFLTMGIYVALRVLVALIQFARHPQGRGTATPLGRMLEQYSTRVQGLHEEPEIDQVTVETLKLGLGCDASKLLLASPKDFSWRTADGETLPEDRLPDPMTFAWLLEYSSCIQRSELPGMRLGDLRQSVEALFEANEADALVPLVNRDEMVGMLLIRSGTARPFDRHELEFLNKVIEDLTAALVYTRMRREVNRRVAAHKEVELAGAVQKAFVPKGDLVDCGAIRLSGLCAPALQCGGDWWSFHQLSDGRVLVLIGDVTGHGVAAAMITAAAKGCYDVAERLMGQDLDLVRLLGLLDASVRLVGANRLHMTCFVTLLDPANGKVEFANAGHVVPYICRRRDNGGIELGALVTRGNPLGTDDPPRYRACTRSLASGDILIWYTDGIVECTDPDRRQFGERRLQRLLRRIDKLEPNPRAVRDHIARAVDAFQGGQPRDDDITLVIARVE